MKISKSKPQLSLAGALTTPPQIQAIAKDLPELSAKKPRPVQIRNKAAGRGYEDQVIKDLLEVYPNACPSRSNSVHRDNAKVDIMNRDESEHGRMRFNIQCKSIATVIPYPVILKDMPMDNRINVILHKYTPKITNPSTGGTRFVKAGEYAVMSAKDFHRLLRESEALHYILNLMVKARSKPPAYVQRLLNL